MPATLWHIEPTVLPIEAIAPLAVDAVVEPPALPVVDGPAPLMLPPVFSVPAPTMLSFPVLLVPDPEPDDADPPLPLPELALPAPPLPDDPPDILEEVEPETELEPVEAADVFWIAPLPTVAVTIVAQTGCPAPFAERSVTLIGSVPVILTVFISTWMRTIPVDARLRVMYWNGIDVFPTVPSTATYEASGTVNSKDSSPLLYI